MNSSSYSQCEKMIFWGGVRVHTNAEFTAPELKTQFPLVNSLELQSHFRISFLREVLFNLPICYYPTLYQVLDVQCTPEEIQQEEHKRIMKLKMLVEKKSTFVWYRSHVTVTNVLYHHCNKILRDTIIKVIDNCTMSIQTNFYALGIMIYHFCFCFIVLGIKHQASCMPHVLLRYISIPKG